MSRSRILNKLLQTGQTLFNRQSKRHLPHQPGAARSGGIDWVSIGTAALSTGALGSLIGGRRQRRGLVGRVSRFGGMMALAGVAYQAYNQWQQQKQGYPSSARPLDQLPTEEANRHSQAMVKAIIAAAKADGHVDEQERQMIEEQIAQSEDNPSLKQWLDQELRKPLDPRDVARSAESPEMAAEIYTASVLIADERNEREQRYLDELARHMQIPPDLKASLEREVRRT